MASLGGAGESVAVVVGAGELGSATATLLAGARFTVVAVDRTRNALNELPGGIRREAGDNLELRPHSIRAPQLLGTCRNRVILAEVLAHAVRPEAAANIIAFLVATAPHSSAVRPRQPTAPSPAASHPATPRI
jgi:2-polyprenyl-6-methoxyphenol hydroxylase-like FAD-dependent oxidoreductase